MTIPVVAFFNVMGGVGKTSLVYHLSWMLADLGHTVVAADLDPQANLTATFLDEEALTILWASDSGASTIFGAIRLEKEGTGDVREPARQEIDGRLSLIAGDLRLSQFEDQLTDAWLRCSEGDIRSFRVTTAFWYTLQAAGRSAGAEVILVDLGPNLGVINRSALVASDYVVVPLASDLVSARGIETLGPKLRQWRTDWQYRLTRKPASVPDFPCGAMDPVGYTVRQEAVRLDRRVTAYNYWSSRIPEAYQRSVLGVDDGVASSFGADSNCLALVKDYRSLILMAQEARKPLFHLRAADGAMGGYKTAAQDARICFETLARRIAERTFCQPLP